MDDGGYLLGGTKYLVDYHTEYWLVRTAPDSTLLHNGVVCLDPAFPSCFTVGVPYPNPFNAVVRFSYSLPTASKVDLGVYDLNGRLIQRLINGQQEAGEYRALWNGDGSPAGVYFLHLKAGNTVQTKRMVLVK